MIKTLITVNVVVLGISAIALTANALVNNNCNYNNTTGNYVSNGTVHAYGTMDSAFQCAMSGVLPQIVVDRLGSLGNSDAKARAKLVIEANESAKAKATN